MKTIQFVLKGKALLCCVVLTASLLSFSCSNNDEQLRKNIVGSFFSVFTENDDEALISAESTETFFEDGKFKDVGTISFTMSGEDDELVKFIYSYLITGTYVVDGSHIVYDVDVNKGIKFSLADASDMDYIDHFSIISDAMLSEMKKIYVENSKIKIVKLDKTHLVTLDSDGEETTAKRVAEPVAISSNNNSKNSVTDIKYKLYPFTNTSDFCNDKYVLNTDETDEGSSEIFLNSNGEARLKFLSEDFVGEYIGSFKENDDENLVCTFTKVNYFTPESDDEQTEEVNRTILVVINSTCDKYPILTHESVLSNGVKHNFVFVGKKS